MPDQLGCPSHLFHPNILPLARLSFLLLRLANDSEYRTACSQHLRCTPERRPSTSGLDRLIILSSPSAIRFGLERARCDAKWKISGFLLLTKRNTGVRSLHYLRAYIQGAARPVFQHPRFSFLTPPPSQPAVKYATEDLRCRTPLHRYALPG